MLSFHSFILTLLYGLSHTYLNRQQVVSVNQVDSNPTDVTCGVPQGSILWPFLFCATLTTCQQVLTAIYSFMLMTVLYLHPIKYPRVISDVLSRELESCRQWHIVFTPWQTESILFGSQHKLSRVDKFEVSCDVKIINPTNSVKYLGITLDENLKGKSIAKSIV